MKRSRVPGLIVALGGLGFIIANCSMSWFTGAIFRTESTEYAVFVFGMVAGQLMVIVGLWRTFTGRWR